MNPVGSGDPQEFICNAQEEFQRDFEQAVSCEPSEAEASDMPHICCSDIFDLLFEPSSSNFPKPLEGKHFGAILRLNMIKTPLKMVPFYSLKDISLLSCSVLSMPLSWCLAFGAVPQPHFRFAY